jgi:hypothetical protein
MSRENFFQQVAEKPAATVTPAEAGVQNALKRLDSRFREILCLKKEGKSQIFGYSSF